MNGALRHALGSVLAILPLAAGCGGAPGSVGEPKTAAPVASAASPSAGEPSAAQSASADSPTDAPRSGTSALSGATAPFGVAGSSVGTSRAPSSVATVTAPPSATSSPSLASPPPPNVLVVDEPIYFPGARTKPKGSAVEVSLDDEIVATWNRGGVGQTPTSGPKGKPLHAAPRVKVDVTEVRGSASEADMQRVARLKSYWPFRICYEQGLRRTQKLHGTIKLRLTIGSSGRPSGVEQLRTELGDGAVVSCVVKSAMGLSLPAPSSGAPLVTLDISLWPGDEPVTVKTAPRGKIGAPAQAEAIAAALRTRLDEVRTCYGAGLGRQEGLWGRLALAIRMNAGAVDEATEVESHFPDPEVTACVTKVLLHTAVPASDSEVVVVYALRLGHPPDAQTAHR